MIRGGGFFDIFFGKVAAVPEQVKTPDFMKPVRQGEQFVPGFITEKEAPAPEQDFMKPESEQVVPGFIEPVKAEPVKAEPVKAEPVKAEPVPVPVVPGFMAAEVVPKAFAKEPGYLDEVNIDLSFKAEILEKSFPTTFFSDAQTSIQDKINEIKINEIKKNKDQKLSDTWVSCNSCSEIAEKITTELNSTAYILRVLSKSFLKASKSTCTISFAVTKTPEEITGVWEDDKDGIEMNFSEENSDQRLIMGFGPSSSGKTHCAQKMIDVFCKTYEDFPKSFPKSFLTIDGGVYRENSKIYRMIVDTLKSNGVAGFTNLVLAGISLETSLFDSNIVKKKIMEYLKKKYTKKVSLYVPETLGGCGYVDYCSSKYKQYKDITGDKEGWIALCIWQHKKGIDCDFTDPYKCLGCTESGTTRQTAEGKQYSNAQWQHSMKEGERAIKEAPGGGYKIHSTGGKKYETFARGNENISKPCVIVIEVVKPDPNKTRLNLEGSGMVFMDEKTMIEIVKATKSLEPLKRRNTLG